MTLPVHLVPSLVSAEVGDSVEVSGDEAHHAVAVRRLRVGEQVALTDGVGTRLVGTITATGKRSLTVEAGSIERAPKVEPEVVVVQAIPKGERGELAVEVLTEVGVGEIVPWAAARSVGVWKGERAAKALARWQAAAREAGKQSRRAWFPVVRNPVTTAEVSALIADADLAVVLHESADASLAAVPVPSQGRILVVVGPEGGLSDDEVAAFEAAGATSVRLGAEVLRTSTAGVAAVAALLSRTPRWATGSR